MKQNKALAIAITGNIGSGKSTVCHFLEIMKFEVHSADRIVHESMEEPQLIKDLSHVFGDGILTENKIDRDKLGKIVFEDEEKLEVLNSMLHPIAIKRLMDEVKKVDKMVFFEVPLLFEVGMEKMFDLVVLITADKYVRLERIMTREGMTLKKAKAINRNQMSDRKKKADYVLTNNGDDCEELTYQLTDLLRMIESDNKEVKDEKD